MVHIDLPEVEEPARRVGQLERLDVQEVAHGERGLARQCEHVEQTQPGVQVAEHVVLGESGACEHVEGDGVEHNADRIDCCREIEMDMVKHVCHYKLQNAT